MSTFKIAKKNIGKNQPTFIVAEISANHNQNFNKACLLVTKAKQAGADAVKFQLYTPDTLTINCHKRYFYIKHPKWGGQTLYDLYKKAYTPWEWFKKLKKLTEDLGMVFFATAFDKSSVDFLEDLDVPIHKIASFELVDLPLIEYAAKTNKLLILSTGMATLKEITDAVNTAKRAGTKKIILLKCVSSYPAMPSEMNLKTIPFMEKLFNFPIGFSDHTLGIGVSIAAVSLGACVIEKHITLSRRINSPDNFFSLEPQEFKDLVKNIRITQSALGKIHFRPTKEEKNNLIFRRSLFVIDNIKKDEIFTERNVKSIRPANGINPKYLNRIINCKARKDLKKGTPLKWNLIKLSRLH